MILPAWGAWKSLETGPEVGVLPDAGESAPPSVVAGIASLFKGAAPSEPSTLSDEGPCGVDGESRVISLMSDNEGLIDNASLASRI